MLQHPSTPVTRALRLIELNPLFLDTETTGLDAQAEMCELAIIDLAGNPVLHSLVKPTILIPGEAENIHGISNTDVAHAPSTRDLWPDISRTLAGRHCVIYNAEYDLRILVQSAAAAGVPCPFPLAGFTAHCLMLLYAEHFGEPSYRGGWRWQRLDAALAQQRISLPPSCQLHRARADAEAARRLLHKMAGTPLGPC